MQAIDLGGVDGEAERERERKRERELMEGRALGARALWEGGDEREKEQERE